MPEPMSKVTPTKGSRKSVLQNVLASLFIVAEAECGLLSSHVAVFPAFLAGASLRREPSMIAACRKLIDFQKGASVNSQLT